MQSLPRRSAQRHLPWSKLALAWKQPRKTFVFVLIVAIYWVRRLWSRDYVIVSPTPPATMYGLWKIAMIAGIKQLGPEHAERPDQPALATIRHIDNTWDTEAAPTVMNGRCRDISKTHVDDVFRSVFGYGTKLDPTTHVGRVVMKSELNAQDGGVFVECPIDPTEVKPGYIYQRLVDNAIDADTVKEYRVLIIGDEMVDVVVQFRSVDRRLQGRGFGGGRGSTVQPAEAVFTPQECADILRFSKLIGLEFGELDVLPDVAEDRIYILDANKTPSFMVSEKAQTLERFRQLVDRGAAFRRLLRARAQATTGASD